jgi:6-phosphofructokinase 1
MGRDAGHIALWTGLVGGAEEIIIPEDLEIGQNTVITQLIENRARGKKHNLIIIAEGRGRDGKTQALAKAIENATEFSTRATILGHLQRGGAPTAIDRMHASMMGYFAVMGFVKGEVNKVIAYKQGRYVPIDIEEALNVPYEYDRTLYDISKTLAI